MRALMVLLLIFIIVVPQAQAVPLNAYSSRGTNYLTVTASRDPHDVRFQFNFDVDTEMLHASRAIKDRFLNLIAVFDRSPLSNEGRASIAEAERLAHSLQLKIRLSRRGKTFAECFVPRFESQWSYGYNHDANPPRLRVGLGAHTTVMLGVPDGSLLAESDRACLSVGRNRNAIIPKIQRGDMAELYQGNRALRLKAKFETCEDC